MTTRLAVRPSRGHGRAASARCRRALGRSCTHKGDFPMAQLLIVEDDHITALALHRAVTRMGHTVVARVASAAEALAAVQAHRPDVVLLDMHLRGPHHGLFVGIDIQTLWSTPVIYLSALNPAQLGMPEFPDALWCYLAKPINWNQLQDILARLFPRHPPHPGVPWSSLEDPLPPVRYPPPGASRAAQTLASAGGSLLKAGLLVPHRWAS
jgi:CheY-like chemotaxis protein